MMQERSCTDTEVDQPEDLLLREKAFNVQDMYFGRAYTLSP